MDHVKPGKRIPVGVQAVFLASNRGEEVHKPPPDKSASRVFTRFFRRKDFRNGDKGSSRRPKPFLFRAVSNWGKKRAKKRNAKTPAKPSEPLEPQECADQASASPPSPTIDVDEITSRTEDVSPASSGKEIVKHTSSHAMGSCHVPQQKEPREITVSNNGFLHPRKLTLLPVPSPCRVASVVAPTISRDNPYCTRISCSMLFDS